MRGSLLLVAVAACLLVPASQALAVDVHGDFNNDGEQDVAIGVPGEAVGNATSAGAVNVIYGSPGGVGGGQPGAQLFDQNTSGIAGVAEAGDRFGLALVAGDFNNDPFDDLAVGVPDEDVGGRADAGVVGVIYGSAGGLAVSGGPGAQLRSQGGAFGAQGSGDRFGAALAAGDFDGSSVDDLAVGAPGESGGAGVVDVIYASGSGGLDSSVGADEALSQGTPGIPGASERGDRWGLSLAGGDFNGDGDDDLAVGAPDENLGSSTDAGAVGLIYSSGLPDQGLEPVAGAGGQPGAQLFDQNTSGIPGAAEARDRFGLALVAGDFNNDPFDDLAAGTPDENVGGVMDAGVVGVIYGSASGLAASGGPGAQLLGQGGAFGAAGPGDRFGAALAAGDFDSSSVDDLAVGAPGEGGGAGAVDVTYASGSGGLDSSVGADEVVSQGTPGVPGVSERGDGWGLSLSGGDFNGDGDDDLAVGVPHENLGSRVDAGAVGLIYSSGLPDQGLEPVGGGAGGQPGAQLFDQNSPGIPGAAERRDRFGLTL